MLKHRFKTLLKLVSYLKEFTGLMIINLIIGFLYRMAPLAISFIVSYIVGTAIENIAIDLKFFITILLAIIIFRAFLAYLDMIIAHDIAYKILFKLRFMLYERLEKLMPAYNADLKSGELVAIAAEDVNILEWFYAHTANIAVIIIFILATVLSVLGTIHIYFPIIVMIFCIINIIIPIYYTSSSQKDGDYLRSSLSKLNNLLTDYVQGLREIISFNGFSLFKSQLNKKVDDNNLAYKRYAMRQGKESALSYIVTILSTIVLILVSRKLYILGDLELRWIPVVLTLASGVFVPLNEFMNMTSQFGQIFSAADRVIKLLNMDIEIKDLGKDLLKSPIKSLEFKNVSYKYPKAENYALKNISFKINSGESFALAGESGSGKSTIINLIERFADPSSGEILINGKNIKDYSLKSLRENLSIVSQKSYIFNDTVMNNLKLGNPNASDNMAKAAAKIVGAEDFINELPNGYDTFVGERATKISGGEAQRLSIVRAILKDSDILVFDEASSHLDTENEAFLNKSMSKFKDKIILTVAHRNNTIARAEKILFLHEGEKIAEGSYEMLSKNKLFKERIMEQMNE